MDIITKLSIKLVSQHRYYASFLSRMTKIATKEITTAGVGFNKNGDLTLYYNQEWLEKMEVKDAMGVMAHEVLHVFLRHLTRLPKCGDKYDTIRNWACDIAINQLIKKSPTISLPKEALMPDQFKMPEDKCAEWYFEELKKRQDEQEQKKDKQKGEGKGEEEGEGQPQSGKGEQKQKSILDDHDLWQKVLNPETGEVTSAESNGIDPEYVTKKVVAKVLKEIENYGNLPQFMKDEIAQWKKVEKKVNWKRQLKIFINTVLTSKTRLSQKKINRRFIDLDYILPGFKKTRRPSLLVARDTSGSVYNEETQSEFLNEIICISKFADVFVVDCDTQIHQAYKIKNKQDFKVYKGGGGTSFVPVFNYAMKHSFDGIIYLTDTYGDFPTFDVRKFKTKTIWATIDQASVSVPFGKHLNIESK